MLGHGIQQASLCTAALAEELGQRVGHLSCLSKCAHSRGRHVTSFASPMHSPWNHTSHPSQPLSHRQLRHTGHEPDRSTYTMKRGSPSEYIERHTHTRSSASACMSKVRHTGLGKERTERLHGRVEKSRFPPTWTVHWMISTQAHVYLRRRVLMGDRMRPPALVATGAACRVLSTSEQRQDETSQPGWAQEGWSCHRA